MAGWWLFPHRPLLLTTKAMGNDQPSLIVEIKVKGEYGMSRNAHP